MALIILLLVSALSIYDAADANETRGPAAVIRQEIIGHDGAPLVLIPAGFFPMGSETGQADERPVHRIELDAFYIDKYEVAVSRYARFLRPNIPTGRSSGNRRLLGHKDRSR